MCYRACVGVGGWLKFFDEKVNKQWVAYHLSPFLEEWRKYVCVHRHPGTPDNSPIMRGGRNALRDALKTCFHRHSRGPLTWHPWGRLGLHRMSVWVDQSQTSQRGPGGQAKSKHAITPNTPPKWEFSESVTPPPSPKDSRAHRPQPLSSSLYAQKRCGQQTPRIIVRQENCSSDSIIPLSRAPQSL